MQFRKGFRLWWLMPSILLADQASKLWARGLTGAVTAVPGVFSFTHVRNRGVAFSLLSGIPWLPIALSAVLILLLLAYQLHHAGNSVLERIGLWCIISGGLGNLIDRIILGGVTDFIRLDFVSFAIFNVADIFVCLGAALAALGVFTSENGRKNHG